MNSSLYTVTNLSNKPLWVPSSDGRYTTKIFPTISQAVALDPLTYQHLINLGSSVVTVTLVT